jgi:hypothetical protein
VGDHRVRNTTKKKEINKKKTGKECVCAWVKSNAWAVAMAANLSGIVGRFDVVYEDGGAAQAEDAHQFLRC